MEREYKFIYTSDFQTIKTLLEKIDKGSKTKSVIIDTN
jgi:hypothetical protein